MKWLIKRDGIITAALLVFCAVMTFFLIRVEYFSEFSFLHRIPTSHLLSRFLRGDNTSALKLTWKNHDAGSFSVRVTPGEKPFLKSSGQIFFYLLTKKEKIHFDSECRLNSRREVERFRIHGILGETRFRFQVDTLKDLFRIDLEGLDSPFQWECSLKDIIENGGEKFLKQLPELPWGIPLPKRWSASSLVEGWTTVASTVRIDRLGDWMDAYLLLARSNQSQWVKLWMSPTGDILEFDSSFGWRAKNIDFFEGINAPEARDNRASLKGYHNDIILISKSLFQSNPFKKEPSLANLQGTR
jgi:hypothetical protein